MADPRFRRDDRTLRVALLISVVLHLLLLMTDFPVPARREPAQSHGPFILRRYVPMPLRAVEPLQRRIDKQQPAAPVIPDPSPDEPEPLLVEPLEAPLPPEPTSPVAPGGDIARPVARSACFSGIDYTMLARILRIEGRVVVEAIIDKQGTVREARVIAGLGHGLDEQALEALRRCSFEPGFSKRTGRPVEVIFTLNVDFHLVEPTPSP